jgi:hypothetical protein
MCNAMHLLNKPPRGCISVIYSYLPCMVAYFQATKKMAAGNKTTSNVYCQPDPIYHYFFRQWTCYYLESLIITSRVWEDPLIPLSPLRGDRGNPKKSSTASPPPHPSFLFPPPQEGATRLSLVVAGGGEACSSLAWRVGTGKLLHGFGRGALAEHHVVVATPRATV